MSITGDDAVALREKMRDEQRKKNREIAPNLAALVDEFKAQFPDCKVIWGKDLVTGVELGKKDEPDPDSVFVIPKDYYPSRSVNLKKGR